MQISQTLYVTSRKDWRKWLKSHYKSEPDIWLVYYRKETGKPRIPYNDAVEEALCFGWIDSTVKKIDDQKFAQRFSPRRARSNYSQTNIERLKELAVRGKLMPKVLAAIGTVIDKDDEFEIASDILAAIKASKTAWQNFQTFPDRYKRIRIGFIEGARNRPPEFQKRLNYFIRMSEQNKQFGYGRK